VNWYDASFTGQTSAAATATAGRPDVAVRNLAVTPGDYSPYCITTPVNPKLPGGGGQQLCGLFDLNPNRVGQVNNLVTFKGNYGNPKEYYDGIDLTFNARILRNGSLLSGGMNTGRLVYDNCFVVNSPQDLFDCRVVQPFQPQFKLQGVFSLPKGFQASATWQNLPGIEIDAIYNAPNAVIAPSLGRNLSAGANATASVWLIPPQTQFEPRLSQTDARIGKVLKVGRIKVQGNFDIYNLFNANNILGLNLTYGPAWLTPTQILAGRLFRGNVQIDF
jgi:hypothetical protein